MSSFEAIDTAGAPVSTKPSSYPEPFAAKVAGRVKRPLGELFGLRNFGVNRTTLQPGAVSALLHRHSLQDEMVFVLEGHPTLCVGDTESVLQPGMCAGFAAGGLAHCLRNDTAEDVVYLEIGDRTVGDQVEYPLDDLQVVVDVDGKRRAAHKDGRLY